MKKVIFALLFFTNAVFAHDREREHNTELTYCPTVKPTCSVQLFSDDLSPVVQALGANVTISYFDYVISGVTYKIHYISSFGSISFTSDCSKFTYALY